MGLYLQSRGGRGRARVGCLVLRRGLTQPNNATVFPSGSQFTLLYSTLPYYVGPFRASRSLFGPGPCSFSTFLHCLIVSAYYMSRVAFIVKRVRNP